MVENSEDIRNTSVTGYGLDYHNGMAFSTADRDQDKDETGNCAAFVEEAVGGMDIVRP